MFERLGIAVLALVALGAREGAAESAPAPAAAEHEAAPEDPGQLDQWIATLEVSSAARGGAQRVRRAASALREAIERAEPAPRGDLPRAAHRCALGIVLTLGKQAHPAHRYLAACEGAAVPQALRERGVAMRTTIERTLRRSQLAPFDLSAAQPGWVAAVDDDPAAWFVLPQTVWLSGGSHKLRAAPSVEALAGSKEIVERTLRAEAGKRGGEYIAAPVAAAPPKQVTLDMGEESALEPPTTGPPPPSKHVSLLPGKYQRGVRAQLTDEGERRERGMLVVQASAGAGDGANVTRVALHAGSYVRSRLALELGIDWHYRFADEMSQGRSGFGALAGARVLLWAPRRVSLLVGARGRLDPGGGERDATMTGGALAQLEARPLGALPLIVGAQLEIEPAWRAASAMLGFELWRR